MIDVKVSQLTTEILECRQIRDFSDGSRRLVGTIRGSKTHWEHESVVLEDSTGSIVCELLHPDFTLFDKQVLSIGLLLSSGLPQPHSLYRTAVAVPEALRRSRTSGSFDVFGYVVSVSSVVNQQESSPFFLLELSVLPVVPEISGNSVTFVLFSGLKAVRCHPLLQIRERVFITNVKSITLFNGTPDARLALGTSSPQVLSFPEGVDENKEPGGKKTKTETTAAAPAPPNKKSTIGYAGVITNCLGGGVYELDGRFKLVMTHKPSKFGRGLRNGASIVVSGANPIWQKGHVVGIALCPCSNIRVSAFAPASGGDFTMFSSSHPIIGSLSKQLPLTGPLWLVELEERLLTKFGKEFKARAIVKHIASKILRGREKAPSHLDSFVSHRENGCWLLSSPSLPTVVTLAEFIAMAPFPVHAPGVHYRVTRSSELGWVLIGCVRGGSNGRLQLDDLTGKVSLVVEGDATGLLHTRVLFTDFEVVTEIVSGRTRTEKLVYVRCRASEAVILTQMPLRVKEADVQEMWERNEWDKCCLVMISERYENTQKDEAYSKALVFQFNQFSAPPPITLQFRGEKALRIFAELSVGILYAVMGAAVKQMTEELGRNFSTNAPVCLSIDSSTTIVPVVIAPVKSESETQSLPAATGTLRSAALTLRCRPQLVSLFEELSSRTCFPSLSSVRALLLSESSVTMVSFRAIVIAKDLFDSDLGEQKVCVRVRDLTTADTVSIYISCARYQLPLSLLPGTSVTFLRLLRKVAQTGNLYCVYSPLSAVVIDSDAPIATDEEEEIDEVNRGVHRGITSFAPLDHGTLPCVLLRTLILNATSRAVSHVRVHIEGIFSASFSLRCSSCSSVLYRQGTCPGACVQSGVCRLESNICVTASDGSAECMMSAFDDCAFKLVQASPSMLRALRAIVWAVGAVSWRSSTGWETPLTEQQEQTLTPLVSRSFSMITAYVKPRSARKQASVIKQEGMGGRVGVSDTSSAPSVYTMKTFFCGGAEIATYCLPRLVLDLVDCEEVNCAREAYALLARLSR